MTCGGLLVRRPGEAKSQPYEALDLIPAGSTIEVAARFSTYTKQGSARAAVLLDVLEDEELRTERLEIRCEVQPFLLIEPRRVDLGKLKQGETKEVLVTLRTQDRSSVTLKGPASPLPGFETSLLAVAPDRFGRASQWKLRLSSSAEQSTGLTCGSVSLTCEDALPGIPADSCRVVIPCQYRVRAPLEASQSHVSFGIVHLGGPVKTKNVTLRRNSPDLDLASIIPVFEREPGQPAKWSDGVQLRVLPSSVEGEMTLEAQLPKPPPTAEGPFR